MRLVQWLRWLLKATVWYPATALLDRAGARLETVQVLCVDLQAQRMLLLRTPECPGGYCPVQGMRRGAPWLGLCGYRPDPRVDARRELGEEALVDPPALEEFHVAERYREGRWVRFDCTVLVVFCRAASLRLRAESGEGRPVWMPIERAVRVLDNRLLKGVLLDVQGDPPASELSARQRYLRGPPHAVERRAAAPAAAVSVLPAGFWSMPARMLAAVRALGRRPFEDVYQSNAAQAAQFHDALSAAERSDLAADSRLWLDCRSLDERDAAPLLSRWPQARDEEIRAGIWGEEVRSVPGWITPAAAIAIQRRTGCEISLDLVYDADGDRAACFVTRGGGAGVMSNLLLYALMSARYMPIPVFHTHPVYRTEITGYKQPSLADCGVMGSLRRRYDGAAVGDCVFFPDGSWTEYGVTGQGRCFYRRAGDALLPPGGEPVTTLFEIGLRGTR